MTGIGLASSETAIDVTGFQVIVAMCASSFVRGFKEHESLNVALVLDLRGVNVIPSSGH